MKNRYITWEIILAGLALTFLGFYILDDSERTNRDTTVQSSTNRSSETPESAPAIFHLNPDKLENLEELKKLEQVENLAELKQKLQELKQAFNEEQLEQMEEQLKQNLEQLERSEIQVQVDNGQKLTIRKKFQTPLDEWTEVSSGDYVFRSKLNPDHLQSLNFTLSAGQFNVVGGNSDNPHLSLRASGHIESPEKLKEQVGIQIDESSDGTRLIVENRGHSGFFRKLNVEATLFVPSDTRINASTNGGHITANDLSNLTKLSTNGGHITLEKVFGESKIQTKGGHITVSNSGGSLMAQTSGGHIKLNNFNGTASANTSGGHLYFREIEGSVSGSTSGGNVKAAFIKLEGDSKLSTSAGNISLELPLDTRAKIKLKGMNAGIDDAFNFRGNKESDMISGIIMPVDTNISEEEVPQLQASCNIGNVSLSVYER